MLKSPARKAVLTQHLVEVLGCMAHLHLPLRHARPRRGHVRFDDGAVLPLMLGANGYATTAAVDEEERALHPSSQSHGCAPWALLVKDGRHLAPRAREGALLDEQQVDVRRGQVLCFICGCFKFRDAWRPCVP